MRLAFWREYLRMYVNFFPLGNTTVYGRRLYKVTLAPSIGTTKHDAPLEPPTKMSGAT
jgi:hypothetical protein